jgi:pyroglutamyl-peptidase
MPVTVLITGFGPFAGAPHNPTARLAKALARCRRPALARIERIAHVFRTSYAAVERELPDLMKCHRPDLVLLFGLAQRTPYLRVETRASNRRASLFSDVDGMHPPSVIRPGGPAIISASAPEPALQAARRADVPVRLSIDAGKYVCNFAYWQALELARDCGAVAQFVHVPKVRGPQGRKTRFGAEWQLTEADLLRAAEAILLAMLTVIRERKPKRSRFVVTGHRADSAVARSERGAVLA